MASRTVWHDYGAHEETTAGRTVWLDVGAFDEGASATPVATTSVVYFTGFETGDLSEVDTAGAISVNSASTRTGAWGATHSGGVSALISGLSLKQSGFRGYYRYDVTATAAINAILQPANGSSAGSQLVTILHNSAQNTLLLRDGTNTPIGVTTATGTTIMTAGSFFRIEMLLDTTASGTFQVLLNGNLEFNLTHSLSSVNIERWRINGTATRPAAWDDILIRNDLTTAGPGQCVARQGLSAVATYNAWTGSGTSGIELAWSDTPYTAGTSYAASVSSAMQTMTVADIAATQTGHGSQIISSTDTINGMKIGMIARASATSQLAILRRIGGSDTEAPSSSVVTTDAWRQSDIFATGYTAVRTIEIGVKHEASTQYQQVEDMWLMIDYTPSAAAVVAAKLARLRMLMGIGR